MWKKIDENYKMLIHFQTAEAVHSSYIENNTAVGGYDKGIIRFFDIVEGQMTLKLSVPQLTDVQICTLEFDLTDWLPDQVMDESICMKDMVDNSVSLIIITNL